MSRATVVEFRENLSEYLGRAQHGSDRVTITRNGKPVAAMISIEDLELLRALEDQFDRATALDAVQEAEESGYLSWDDLKNEDDD